MTNILIVEDDKMSQDMLSRRLRRAGYSVTIVETGKSAIEIIKHESFDIILMDIGLPDMDGLDVTRQIKQNPNLKSIPIIALTAHAFKEDFESALAAGCDDFDTKPIQLPRLLSKIEQLIKK